MDDELKAIQADLDSVLDRLAAYVSSEEVDGAGKDREAAARVVLHYAREGVSLEASVLGARDVARGRWQGPKIKPESRLGELTKDDQPERLAHLVEAMRALWEWQWHRLPIEDCHSATLARAIDAWSGKECRFIGESVGLGLTPKRQVDPQATLRKMAALDARHRHQDDPAENPTGAKFFERIGQGDERAKVRRGYGLSEATVRRAYYSEEVKEMWEEVERIEPSFRRDDKT